MSDLIDRQAAIKAIEYFKDIQRMGQIIIDEEQEMIRMEVEKWTK